MRIFWCIYFRQDITVTGDNNTDIAFINCAPFSTCKTEINDLFNQNNSANFETESIKSSLWGYFDAFVLLTRDITATTDNNRNVTCTNCALFCTCQPEINDLFKQNNFLKFKTKSIISSLWESFDPSSLVKVDKTVNADNNRDVAFINYPPFSTCKTQINDLFNQNKSANFEKESMKSSPLGYFGAFILVTGDITANADNNTDDTFTNCVLFCRCKTEIKDFFNERNSTNSETKSIEWSLWDYFESFILLTAAILVTADNNKHVAFTNCVLFSPCETVN